MKTNKEKARELINDSPNRDLHTDRLPILDALFAIEIASKPDWFDPNSKNQDMPEPTEIFCDNNGTPCVMLVNFKYRNLLTNEIDFIENLKVWTYLPKFDGE